MKHPALHGPAPQEKVRGDAIQACLDMVKFTRQDIIALKGRDIRGAPNRLSMRMRRVGVILANEPALMSALRAKEKKAGKPLALRNVLIECEEYAKAKEYDYPKN